MVSALWQREISEIITATDALDQGQLEDRRETTQRVAYLGPSFSHSYDATLECFESPMAVECSTFRRIFELLLLGEVDYGLVPVDNSIGGSVFEPLHELFEWTDRDSSRRVIAVGEHVMPIRNFLAASQPISLSDVKEKVTMIQSKEEVFRQCADWLRREGLDGKLRPESSSSEAARLVKGDTSGKSAVICSRSAVEHFGLNLVVPQPITDDPTNRTRFLKIQVFSKEPMARIEIQTSLVGAGSPPTGTDIPAAAPHLPDDESPVSLFFAVLRDTRAALSKTLNVFSKFNLRNVTIAPMPQRMRISPEFKHWFLFEFESSLHDDEFVAALARLKRRSDLQHAIKVVGSFSSPSVDLFIPVSRA